MNPSFPRHSIIVDTAPPPPPTLGSVKPTVVYAEKSTSTAARAFNASADAVNVTMRNVTHQVTSAVSSAAKAISRETASAAPSGNWTTASDTTPTTTTTTGIRWSEELNRMTTTSVSERASRLSLLHFFAWILLFSTLTMTTVVLLNWVLRSRQSAADARGEEEDEEMPTKAFVFPSTSSTQGTLAEGPSSASSSSNRLLASRGNLARQQFLESRKTGGNAKNYGGTGTT
ncbi:hypothetical protein ABB37_01792 [Leptomonas pyrrhocoris]|uniref:Transmembrane protein n=1 Tax=Leptomonas pyrrhocoris TaxID=157538 RepID=A0A0M9G9I6_LEPPY|nr:hypothetical protein ABB37_01792 [Leptomonas pyrrhocoris]KPA85517.1 hypothetical protein ABB37_01792 [Leptomonas pyrrhocoris]|eukprot:XP_015663956.1 hypothetical protein ABB37_01792 [Leptomonas pyrrhocoris]